MLTPKGKLLVDRTTVIAHPDIAKVRDQKNYGIDIDSNFGNWQTQLKYAKLDYDYDYGALPLPAFFDASSGNVFRAFASQAQFAKEEVLQFTANGEFKVAELRNRVTFGYDYREKNTRFSGVFDRNSRLPLNIYTLGACRTYHV